VLEIFLNACALITSVGFLVVLVINLSLRRELAQFRYLYSEKFNYAEGVVASEGRLRADLVEAEKDRDSARNLMQFVRDRDAGRMQKSASKLKVMADHILEHGRLILNESRLLSDEATQISQAGRDEQPPVAAGRAA
jgi:hypothetical protein